MKIILKQNIEVRVGSPRLDAPCYNYLTSGSTIEVEENFVKGDLFYGNDLWYKGLDGCYYWSGAVNIIPFESKELLNDLPWWINDFGINQIWEKTKGSGVNVITLDTGYKKIDGLPINNLTTRSIFKNPDKTEENGIDNDGHGTLMASIIAGNSDDFKGIAPDCQIISVKMFKNRENSVNNWDNFLKGLDKIEELIENNKTYIVNCSFSGIVDDITISKIQAKVDNLNRNYKIVFICAVGNDSTYDDPNITPARKIKNVISIAAFDRKKNRLLSSNYWPEIDLTCPGEFMSSRLSAYFKNLKFVGSSQACAYATGLIALFLSKIDKPERQIYNRVSEFLSNSSLISKNEYCKSFKIINKTNLLKTITNL